jgi:DNA-binding NtrC family response regulator
MPTALIVEDEVWIAGEIEECLQALGFAPVLLASTGQQALDHLKKNGPKIDLITLDLKLPEGPQGGQVLEVVPDDKSVKVIICSAHDPVKFIDDDNIYRKASATIRKPFTQEQLKSTVLTILPHLTPDYYPTG